MEKRCEFCMALSPIVYYKLDLAHLCFSFDAKVHSARVYDMHNVVVSIKSRRVPGAMIDDEFFNSSNENESENELDDILTEEERRQLEVALKMDSTDLSNENGDGFIPHHHSCYDQMDAPIKDINGCRNGETKQEKKGWFNGWRRRENKLENEKRIVPPRSSLCVEEKVSDLLEDSPSTQNRPGRHSVEVVVKRDEQRRGRDSKVPSTSNSETGNRRKDGSRENEYKKGLRLILWLSPDFLSRTDELLPLLEILANKVKAIRRLRELFTTKLPKGTFPVKACGFLTLVRIRLSLKCGQLISWVIGSIFW